MFEFFIYSIKLKLGNKTHVKYKDREKTEFKFIWDRKLKASLDFLFGIHFA